MAKTFKELFDLRQAPCSILVTNLATGNDSHTDFHYGQIDSDTELKNLFDSFDVNEFRVRGANLNGHRMPAEDVSGYPVATVIEKMRQLGKTDAYFPTFYIVGAMFDVEDGKRQWGIEQSNSGKPYVYVKKPWAPSYSILGHFHERSVYHLEESETKIFAIQENPAIFPAEQIQLTSCEAAMVRHTIETGEGLIKFVRENPRSI